MTTQRLNDILRVPQPYVLHIVLWFPACKREADHFAGLFRSKYIWCFYGTHLYPQTVLTSSAPLIRTDESCGCDYITITVISKENNQFLRCENTRSWKLFTSTGIFSQQWFLESLDSQRLSVYLSLAEVFSVGCLNNCLTTFPQNRTGTK